MNIRELIEKLKELDPEMEVYGYHGGNDTWGPYYTEAGISVMDIVFDEQDDQWEGYQEPIVYTVEKCKRHYPHWEPEKWQEREGRDIKTRDKYNARPRKKVLIIQ